jgi:hypothetical protein
MRPNLVVMASDKSGRTVLHGLYYSRTKAEAAFRRLQQSDADGAYRIELEDGRFESAVGHHDGLAVTIRFLGDHIWTEKNRWKKSFFDTSEDEFRELANTFGIPAEILKEIAHYERDYIENRGSTRWNAWKRAYLPRWMYR